MIRKKFAKQLLTVTIGAVIGSTSTLGNLAYAQNNNGAVAGVVSEAGSSTLAGAQVTITSKDTGFSRTVTADSEGRYRFSRLPIGNYQIRARNEGFESVLVENVRVTIGALANVDVSLSSGSLEEVVVVGDQGSYRIDLSSSESGMTINSSQLEFLPVGRSLDAVALLAPGAVSGTEFGGLSFGGSSAGENAVFVNGLNVSDVETGVGFATVPQSFYEEFQIKTGGYSVEYGRTTGGVVNAVVKRGGNEFKYGAETYYTPDSLRGKGRDGINRNGERYANTSDTEVDKWTTSIHASGPIIQDKLFFYALYEPRNRESEFVDKTGMDRTEAADDSAFWGARLDWQIAEDHTLELVGFSDKADEISDFYDDGSFRETSVIDTGGENYIGTYTGYFGDNLMARVMYGHSETSYVTNNTTGQECNRIYDEDIDANIGCTAGQYFDGRLNSRDALRLDFEYTLGDHLLRFGMDNETRTTEMDRRSTGPDQQYYKIETVAAGGEINEVVVGDETTYVQVYKRNISGVFDQDTSAFYLEDIWSLNDDMTLTMGLRYDEFDAMDAGGESFIKIDGMISPRAGFAWDLNGDGQSKLYANAGRYYFPLANGMPAREGGGSEDIWNFYELAGLDTNTTSGGLTNITPIFGDQIGDTVQFGAAGEGRDDLDEVVDNDLEASYQDEFILGYERLLNEEWKVGVRGIYREFHNAIEDMRINVDTANCGNISGWVFANPGRKLTLTRDCGNGPEKVSIDLGETQDFDVNGNPIGGPEAERDYKALELTLNREWYDNWMMSFSYTLSRAEGNYEGSVNSDTGNDIPGWTEAGDNVAYMLGNYGRGPNDRTHAFKLYGAYQVTENLTLSANYSLVSGRPINARASKGTGNPFTESSSYLFNYLCVANCSADSNGDRVFTRIDKGDYGDTDWVSTLNVGATYNMPLGNNDLVLGLTAFNLLNSQSATNVIETIDTSSTGNNENFLTPYEFQDPRSVQLTARMDF